MVGILERVWEKGVSMIPYSCKAIWAIVGITEFKRDKRGMKENNQGIINKKQSPCIFSFLILQRWLMGSSPSDAAVVEEEQSKKKIRRQ